VGAGVDAANGRESITADFSPSLLSHESSIAAGGSDAKAFSTRGSSAVVPWTPKHGQKYSAGWIPGPHRTFTLRE